MTDQTEKPIGQKDPGTHIEYSKPNSPLPKKVRDDSPTGEGNTIGKIVGQSTTAKVSAKEANAIPNVETPEEKNWWENTWEATVEAKDNVVDWAKEKVGDQVEAIKHPVERAKGLAKGTYNTLVGLAESYAQGAYMMSTEDSEEAARWYEKQGEPEKAKIIREIQDTQKKQAGTPILDDLKVKARNRAQKGGMFEAELTMVLAPLPAGKTRVIKSGVTELASVTSKASNAVAKSEIAAAKKSRWNRS
ncbi:MULTISPECIES: hypothetical protein [Xenorhabdus]|uniref:hypothetical protein n=1 Tax=Xenorhabdus TaxID=626 RepID=UPI000649BD1B|nr:MULTISPECIES: hypothetical protein [Xenorhabdus]KLU15767.1 hypothetical protein AAY47_09080 [Xenorhabdus griffiniae]KOP35105.1 hypothetical protein AFK69_00985 [Xenorhabdus sp. GDc328]